MTLYPAERLDVHSRYSLTFHGASAGGITDTGGRLLDGQGNGRAGSDFQGLITRQTLAGPATAAGAILAPKAPQPRVPTVMASMVDLLATLNPLPAKPAFSPRR